MKTDVKEKLFTTTVALLHSHKCTDRLTAREIATTAGVNLAMINYYFKSKDELIYLAINELMREESSAWLTKNNSSISAYEKLRGMLIHLHDITVKYSKFSYLKVEYELIKADITMPQFIIPLIREICGGRQTELSIRMTAYQIVSFLQLVFIRAKEFYAYTGVDALSQDGYVQIIDTLLASHFIDRDE